MILIELESVGRHRFRLEFHPRFTVVAGLNAVQRRQLAAAINAAFTGADTGLLINVDVGGIPQPLTTALVHQLTLDHGPIENLVTAADLPAIDDAGDVEISEGLFVEQLPAALFPNVDNPVAATSVESLIANNEQIANLDNGENLGENLDESLLVAQVELQAATLAADTLGKQLEQYREQQQRAANELEDAQRRHADTTVRVMQLTDAVYKLTTEPAERLTKLRVARYAIEARLDELRDELDRFAADPTAVSETLKAVKQLGDRQPVEDTAKLAEILERWIAASEQLDHARHVSRPPTWLVAQSRDALDDAKGRVNALSGQLQEGINVREQLTRARAMLDDAQAVWDELQDGGLHGNVATLYNERAQTYELAITALGHDPGVEPMTQALRDELDQRRQIEGAWSALLDALAAVGVEPADPNDVLEAAEAWLQRYQDDQSRRSELRRQLAAAMVDLKEVNAEQEDLDDEAGNRQVRLEQLEGELPAVRLIEQQADEAVVALQRASSEFSVAELAALEVAHLQAVAKIDVATRKIEHFIGLISLRAEQGRQAAAQAQAAAVALAAAQAQAQVQAVAAAAAQAAAAAAAEAKAATVAPPHWWNPERQLPADEEVPAVPDVSTMIEGDLDYYVLSRAAALRRRAKGESVPLLIDAAFDQLPDDLAFRMLNVLPRIAPIVQVVYFSDTSMAERWVAERDEMVVAVCHIEPI